jgi:hypothetical protein
MSSGWLALTWIVIFTVVGGVTASWLLARARTAQARAGAELNHQYESLLTRQSATNEQVAGVLAQLNDRLGAIEKMLRDVG